jgi:PAS domain S-box-containing protein
VTSLPALKFRPAYFPPSFPTPQFRISLYNLAFHYAQVEFDVTVPLNIESFAPAPSTKLLKTFEASNETGVAFDMNDVGSNADAGSKEASRMQDSAEQLKLYRLLVENSLGLMCIHDLDGVLRFINPAAAQSLGYNPEDGYKPEDGVGRNLRDYLAPSVRHLFDEYLCRIQREPTSSGLMRVEARDGSERIWFCRNVRYDEPGGLPLVLGHAIDITERIRAERALKEAQTALQEAHDQLAARVAERTAELQQANERLLAEMEQRKQVEEELLRGRKLESLGVLAGGIAHDFNNLLTIISGNIALAKMHLKPADSVCNILEQAAVACNRATSLALQLLTFGKGGAPVRRPAPLVGVVKDAVDLARAGAQVSIDLAIVSDLWSAEIDIEQIGQALHNILLNARQAMLEEGGIIEVRAENVVFDADSQPLRSGRYVMISVRDHGCGIEADVLPRIFDPYFTTKQSGSGLGLATVHAIIAKHEGHITVRSMLGVGTTFSVYLPACAAAPPAESVIGRQLQTGSGRILVMDDEEALRKLLAQILERLGYEVECAREGAEAIELYQRAVDSGHCFDAVLLDLTIAGGMGGKEVASRLREVDDSVILIVSSGYSNTPVMSEFRSYGFDDVISKPWTPVQLSEVLRRCARPLGNSTIPTRHGDEG